MDKDLILDSGQNWPPEIIKYLENIIPIGGSLQIKIEKDARYTIGELLGRALAEKIDKEIGLE